MKPDFDFLETMELLVKPDARLAIQTNQSVLLLFITETVSGSVYQYLISILAGRHFMNTEL